MLLGETGTGKELFARAIHRMSSRSGRTFVRLSGAALPSGLLESELFGYEKGAFTGATSSRIGRVELAHRGTLFLMRLATFRSTCTEAAARACGARVERLGQHPTRYTYVGYRLGTNRDWIAWSKTALQNRPYYRLSSFPSRSRRCASERRTSRFWPLTLADLFARLCSVRSQIPQNARRLRSVPALQRATHNVNRACGHPVPGP